MLFATTRHRHATEGRTWRVASADIFTYGEKLEEEGWRWASGGGEKG